MFLNNLWECLSNLIICGKVLKLFDTPGLAVILATLKKNYKVQENKYSEKNPPLNDCSSIRLTFN